MMKWSTLEEEEGEEFAGGGVWVWVKGDFEGGTVSGETGDPLGREELVSLS